MADAQPTSGDGAPSAAPVARTNNALTRAGSSIRIAITPGLTDQTGVVTTEVAGFLSEVNIRLADLPPYVAEKLAAFDADNDGCISTTEIMRHGAALEHARHKNKTYKTMFIILFVAWVAQMAAVFGVVAGVVVYTRQTVVPSGSAALTTKDGSAIVQTAAFSQQSSISSALPDSSFADLTHFTVTAPSGSWVKLAVLGAARITGEGSFGSVVQLLTLAGTVTIDGRSMMFATDVAPVFERAGFNVAPSRRRLLDSGVALAGFFNFLATFDLDALEAAALSIAVPDTVFDGFPSSYLMQATAYTKCDIRSDVTGTWCFSTAAVPLLAANADFPDTPMFGEYVSLTVLGSQMRALSTFSYTSRTHVAVTDSASNALVQGDLDGGWGNCMATLGGMQPPSSIFDPVILANITPVFVDSTSSVLGTAARHFTFTLPAPDQTLPPAMVLHYYDAVATRKPLRVLIQKPLVPQAADVLFDITRFQAISAADVAAGTFVWDGPTYANGLFVSCDPIAIVSSGRAAFELADAASQALAPAPALSAGRRRLAAACSDSVVQTAQCVYSMISAVATQTQCTESERRYTASCCPAGKSNPKLYTLSAGTGIYTRCFTPSTTCVIACCPTDTITTNYSMSNGCIICADTAGNQCTMTPSSPPPSAGAGRRLAQAPSSSQKTLIKGGTSKVQFASGNVTTAVSSMTISFGYDTWPSNAQAYCDATMTKTACQSLSGLFANVTPAYHAATDPIQSTPKALREVLSPLGLYTWLGYDTKPVGADFTCSALLAISTAASGTTAGTTSLQACYRAYEVAVFQAPILAVRTVVSLRTCLTTTAPKIVLRGPSIYSLSSTRVSTTSCDDFMEIVSEDVLSAYGEEFSARRGVLTPNSCVSTAAGPLPNYRASYPGSPNTVFSCAEQYGGLSTAAGAAANFGGTIVVNSTDACFGCEGLASCPLQTLNAVAVPSPAAIFTCPANSVKRFSFSGWTYVGCSDVAANANGRPADFWGNPLGATTLSGATVGPQYTVAECQAAADQMDVQQGVSIYWVGVTAAGDCYATGSSRQYLGSPLSANNCAANGAYAGYPPQFVGGSPLSLAVYGLA